MQAMDSNVRKELHARERIRVSGSSSSPDGPCSVTINGLTSDEQEEIQAFVLGTSWVRVSDAGRLEAIPAFKDVPPPEDDPKLPPKWIPATDWEKLAPFLANPMPPLPDEPNPKHNSPSFIIQHLCGYNSCSYESQAILLQNYGFECLRSRRGKDGRFWELWYLPGTWAAKGDLAAAISKGCDEAKNVKRTIDFLCRNVSFGSLNVSYQRAAMVVD
jgi:hypothetical protein